MEGKYSFTSPEWSDISEDPKDLIRKCLVVDPELRITAIGALQHPFFNTIVSIETRERVDLCFELLIFCLLGDGER